MNPALYIAALGFGAAIMMVPWPPYSWMGRNVAPFVGTLGVGVFLVAGAIGVSLLVVT